MTRIGVIALLVSVCGTLAAGSELKRVCYFTNWAQYRPADGRHLATDVDGSLCSHIMFAFARLQGNSIVHTEWNDLSDQWRKGNFAQLNDLKKDNPGLKTLLSVGGWNMYVASMTAMLATEESRGQFVASAIQYLRTHDFDGLDLVFQYPGNRGSPPEDRERFTLLLQELRAGFEEEAASSGQPRLELSAAVAAGRYLANSAYEMDKIGEHVDFLSLMTYDFTNGWDGRAGHHAPLFAPSGDVSLNNIADSVSYWIEQGAPAEKLVLGLPMHGRGFALADPNNAEYGDLTTGPTQAQIYTREPGILSHYELCPVLADGVRVWNDETKVPHVVLGNQWISYDDEESLAGKVAWLKEQGLAGWMAWSLDMDDFKGTFCEQGAYPLLKALNEASQDSELIVEDPDMFNTAVETQRAPETYKRVCYYTNWAQYRMKPATFEPEHIDVNLCTHIMYAFATMEGNRLAPYEWNDDDEEWLTGMYTRIMLKKSENPNLKISLAVGGWNFGTAKMTSMLATKENRTEFVESSIEYLRSRDFDGLDLDFEFPGSRDSPPEDKHLFTLLCQELRQAYDEEARRTGNPRLLLSIATSAGQETIEKAYEIREMSATMDFVNLMSYDYNGGFRNYTGHNAPLYPRADEDEIQRVRNVEWSVNHWIDNGCPREKLIVGLATYGRGFTLSNGANNDYGAIAYSPSQAGRYTNERGFMAYYELCTMLRGGQATRHWNHEHQVPHLLGPMDQWIGYDDHESLAIKVEWVKRQNLGGVMIWALDLDDFTGGFCNEGKYPLFNTIVRTLWGDRPNPPTPAPTLPPTTRNPKDIDLNAFCQGKASDLYPYPNDETRYIQCSNGYGHAFECAYGSRYNPATKLCDLEGDRTTTGRPGATTRAPTARPTTTRPSTSRPSTARPSTSRPSTSRPSTSRPSTAAPRTTTPRSTTTDRGDIDLNEFCQGKANDMYAYPGDETRYIQCSNGFGYAFDCAYGSRYNPDTQLCDLPGTRTTTGRPGTTARTTTTRRPTTTTKAPTTTHKPTTPRPTTTKRPTTTTPRPTTTTRATTTTPRPTTTTRATTTTQRPTTTTRAPTTTRATTTRATTTPKPPTTTDGGDFDADAFCAGRGEELHGYPGDPSRYIHCANGRGWVRTCGDGTHFSEATKSCSIVVGTTPGGPRTTNAPGTTRHTDGPTTSRPAVTTTSRPQTTTQGGDFDADAFCADRGEELHGYPGDPSRYIHCANGRGWVKKCGNGTHFSEATKSCSIVVGGGGSGTASTPGGGWTTPRPTQPTTTRSNEHDHLCEGKTDGLYPYPGDDRFYVQCFANMGFLQKCADGTLYNPDTQLCDRIA